MTQPKFSLEQITKLTELGNRASDLLINMIEEELPQEKAFERYQQFELVIKDIKKIFPPLSEAYMTMYRDAEQNKFSKEYYFCD